MNAYEKIRAALEMARELIPEYCGIRTQYDDAFAALAELERAAAEPLFLLTTGAIGSDGEQDDWDIECDSPRRLDAFCAAHPGETVKLYTTAPPAPLAEIREPTPEECAAIHKEWMRAHGIEGYGAVCNGRAMFNAVRAVMWPKEGL